MKSVVAYVRSLLGWHEEEPVLKRSFKRDKPDNDYSSDEDSPATKKVKQLKRTSFPEVMAQTDLWNKIEQPAQKVRYVPIQVEGYPSTSTPLEVTNRISKLKTVPVKFVSVTENGPSTPLRKPRIHTPVKSVIHAVIDDDDDDDEVTLIETKPDYSKESVNIYVEDNNENEHKQQDDVVFVKKVSAPVDKPYKFFVSKNNKDETDASVDAIKYYKLSRKLNDRNANLSPRSMTKFKAPPGITKTYKKSAAPVAKWLQAPKTSNFLSSSNRLYNLNGNARSTMSEVFNLDEKRNYQELIRKVAGTTRNTRNFGKPIEVINLAEDFASFRNTLKSQKKSLNEITLHKDLNTLIASEASKEYDPITVASINSSDSEIEIVPSECSTSSSVRIQALNSLRDTYKDKPVTADDYLAKIESKYKKKRQETQEKLRDARRESDIISKVNYEQRIAQLEHKLKYELSIPESLLEEAQPTVELPKLTEEQEKLVNKALGPGPSVLLVEKFNLRIHRRDLQTLSGLNWLNDEVINFYMNLLMQRSEERTDLPKVYATNTFFYPKLMQSGQAGLRRWTRKVDIFAHDLIVVPVHLGVHWCLSLIDFREKKINYLDSMGGRNQACLNALLQYLRDEHQDKKGAAFNDEGWKTECLKDIPQQMNGSDCGMFACTFAEFSSRNAPYTFSQQHMPYLRRKAALEILQGRLLL